MIKLLNAISQLPECVPGTGPAVQATQQTLRTLGRIYHHLLHAYLNIDLSLHDQLVYLSTAAHLILALYHTDRGNFIPVQLYFDVMSMIKNVYYCVAKTQIDNPGGSFWIILLGTDGLEKVFGKVRTMIGNDTNADQLQLTNRIDGAVQCINILEEHPEWGGGSRRLHVKPLSADPDSVSSKHDHINPKSWRGRVKVSDVVLVSCWKDGQRKAETILADANLEIPFQKMDEMGGYDILCPFGSDKMVLVDGKLELGEAEETEEETDQPTLSDDLEPPPVSVDTVDLDPDLDDIAGTTEAHQKLTRPKSEAWISMGSKMVHKSSILRLYSSPLATIDSKDRLKRVRGYSQFNDSLTLDNISPPSNAHPDNDSSKLTLEDPVLTLVRCNNKVFLAVFKVLGIRQGGTDVQDLPTDLLHEPTIRIQGQIMKLALRDVSHQPNGPDWEWIGTFENQGNLCDLEGRWVELVDPDIQQASRGRNMGTDTYTFQTSELREMALKLQQRISSDFARLPERAVASSFPYRDEGGKTPLKPFQSRNNSQS